MTAERFRAAVAVHLFFVREGQVLLSRRANTGYADGLLSVPAGHLDGGESVVAAAVREAEEEVGLILTLEQVRPCGVMHRSEGEERIDFFWKCARGRVSPRIVSRRSAPSCCGRRSTRCRMTWCRMCAPGSKGTGAASGS